MPSTALARAEAMIDAAAAHMPALIRKRAARTAMVLGAADPQCRARYGARGLEASGLDLAGAVALVERAYFAEGARIERAHGTWNRRSAAPGLTLMVLGELRLILRWMRRHDAARFAGDLAAVAAPIGHPVRRAA